MNFSAVILAGGKSSRMGRDKALLEIGGQTMLARQIETAVRPALLRFLFRAGLTQTIPLSAAGRFWTNLRVPGRWLEWNARSMPPLHRCCSGSRWICRI
jgi:hypothetical protein